MEKYYYEDLLSNSGFIPIKNEGCFGNHGKCFRLPAEIGGGYYWIYEPNDMFNIKIHNFWFKDDLVCDMNFPEGLSITYYKSISGEELSPYKRLNSNVVKSYFGGEKPFRALIHKKIPIHSIAIEIRPEYYKNYLQTNYPGEFQSAYEAFRSVDETSNFPQMVALLRQVENYRGEGVAARLFYEAKVAEAVSLVFQRHKTLEQPKVYKLSKADQEMIHTVSSYIKDHYADELSLKLLTKIACISATKLKNLFKTIHGCTITEYIQSCRMGQAEHLFQYTDLSVAQVANAVGYSNASRFAELFRKSTGLLPREYKKRW